MGRAGGGHRDEDGRIGSHHLQEGALGEEGPVQDGGTALFGKVSHPGGFFLGKGRLVPGDGVGRQVLGQAEPDVSSRAGPAQKPGPVEAQILADRRKKDGDGGLEAFAACEFQEEIGGPADVVGGEFPTQGNLVGRIRGEEGRVPEDVLDSQPKPGEGLFHPFPDGMGQGWLGLVEGAQEVFLGGREVGGMEPAHLRQVLGSLDEILGRGKWGLGAGRVLRLGGFPFFAPESLEAGREFPAREERGRILQGEDPFALTADVEQVQEAGQFMDEPSRVGLLGGEIAGFPGQEGGRVGRGQGIEPKPPHPLGSRGVHGGSPEESLAGSSSQGEDAILDGLHGAARVPEGGVG